MMRNRLLVTLPLIIFHNIYCEIYTVSLKVTPSCPAYTYTGRTKKPLSRQATAVFYFIQSDQIGNEAERHQYSYGNQQFYVRIHLFHHPKEHDNQGNYILKKISNKTKRHQCSNSNQQFYICTHDGHPPE